MLGAGTGPGPWPFNAADMQKGPQTARAGPNGGLAEGHLYIHTGQRPVSP